MTSQSDQVKLHMLESGIGGMDRAICPFAYDTPPGRPASKGYTDAGKTSQMLILKKCHEMLVRDSTFARGVFRVGALPKRQARSGHGLRRPLDATFF